MKPQTISQGAEAIIELKDNRIIKKRIQKSYRIKDLDERIRKLRTRAEAKILERAAKIISVPKVLKSDETKKEISMEFLEGKRLSDFLPTQDEKKQKEICKELGKNVALLHKDNIIHGDLTPGNMIYLSKNQNEQNKFVDKLIQLKKLNLPSEEYAVFGSGPIAVHGIRESHDTDIIVKPDLWNKLAKKYSTEKANYCNVIKIGNIEVYENWLPWVQNSDKLINEAEIIEGVKFVRLKEVLKWKKEYNREKDKLDVKFIRDYLSDKNSSQNGKIYFIDFGLSYISSKLEDKAVDLHLLREALEAMFSDKWISLFNSVKHGYSKNYIDSKKILERFTAVEKRGRYKRAS